MLSQLRIKLKFIATHTLILAILFTMALPLHVAQGLAHAAEGQPQDNSSEIQKAFDQTLGGQGDAQAAVQKDPDALQKQKKPRASRARS
jgi:hypothetical protein